MEHRAGEGINSCMLLLARPHGSTGAPMASVLHSLGSFQKRTVLPKNSDFKELTSPGTNCGRRTAWVVACSFRWTREILSSGYPHFLWGPETRDSRALPPAL